MVSKILVAIDGSRPAEKAVVLASDIAQKYGAEVLLLYVVTEAAGANIPEHMRISAEMENVRVTTAGLLRGIGQEVLKEAQDIARGHGVEQVEALIEIGDPAQRIIAAAKDRNVDLIAIGQRGLGDAAALLLGSVSHKVVQLAECPCLTVR